MELLKLRTAPRGAPSSDDDPGIDHLLEDAAADPDLTAAFSDLIDSVKGKLPRDLQDEFANSDTVKTLLADARAILAGDRL